MLAPVELPGADLAYDPAFLPTAEADALLTALREDIAWERHRIRLFGREVDVPRLASWIGDPGTDYRYSGTRFAPRPWPVALVPLRARVEAACGARFNAVLANLYRDGADSMGWHADDEPELGPRPVIASVSLGAPRRFRLRHRRDPARRWEQALAHGSLLLMRGPTQANYRHDLPRTRAVVGPRINLTFRAILPG
jgi:alkylated DNA repair dioxygenase AlkB